jgi:hypothetical protein
MDPAHCLDSAHTPAPCAPPPAPQFDIGSIDVPWPLKMRLNKVWTPTVRDKVSFLIGNALMW